MSFGRLAGTALEFVFLDIIAMPTLHWIGKDKVINHHAEVPFRVLKHKYGFRGENPEDQSETHSGNKIIHGDNLEALKALLPEYEGKIDCIYIDPPYNTGEEKWIYNDNVNDPHIKKWLGEVVGIEGEDLSRHDKWLCMMYPRLRLLRLLLSNTGILFISIDDNEYANLKSICDEIYGITNFVTTFIWEKRKNRENRKVVSCRHDYILCYCFDKNKTERCLKLLPMSDEALSRYQNPDKDPRGLWKSDPATAQAGHATQSQFYTLVAPNGKKHNLPKGRCWLYTEEVMKEAIADGRIWFGESGNNVPRKKTYLLEKERGLTPETILFADDVATNEIAKNNLKDIFSEQVPFTTPKPYQLIEHLLLISSNEDSIILDSFAGSGTTAHAVLNLNHNSQSNRKFIMIEMEDYAEDITAERVRRVIKGYGEGKKSVEGLGGSFDYYELGEPLFKEDGNLNESVGIDKIRAYIYYSETHQYLNREHDPDYPYLLDYVDGIGYFFYYDPNEITTLSHETLTIVPKSADHYVIYADICTISKEELAQKNITFKKIPRDINRF